MSPSSSLTYLFVVAKRTHPYDQCRPRHSKCQHVLSVDCCVPRNATKLRMAAERHKPPYVCVNHGRRFQTPQTSVWGRVTHLAWAPLITNAQPFAVPRATLSIRPVFEGPAERSMVGLRTFRTSAHVCRLPSHFVLSMSVPHALRDRSESGSPYCSVKVSSWVSPTFQSRPPSTSLLLIARAMLS
jgi:hypothetical protein